MKEIKVGSTVVLNKNIYGYVFEGSLRDDVAYKIWRWKKDEVKFRILDMQYTKAYGVYCNIGGFSIPVSCLTII